MPTGNVLGLQGGDTAANIFTHAGDAISADIRRTGQEVAQNVRRIYTNRQLQGFGQEVQGLDPAQPNFVPSLLGMASKYPLAMESEAGQSMMSLLGKQYQSFLTAQQGLTNFQQDKELANIRYGTGQGGTPVPGRRDVFEDRFGNLYRGSTFEILREAPEMPTKLREGEGLFDAAGNPIVEPLARTAAPRFTFGAGGQRTMNTATGDVQELAVLPMTPYQQAQVDARTDSQGLQNVRNQITAINNNLTSLDREAATVRRELDALADGDVRKAQAAARLADIMRSQDELRLRLQQFNEVNVPLRQNNGSMLGGMNAAPLGEQPSLLPTPEELPAPQTRSRSLEYLRRKGL